MLHHLTEIKIINLQGAKFKDPPPLKSRFYPFCNFCLQQLEMSLSSLYGPDVLVCLTTSGHTPNEMIVCVLDLLPDLDQDITELLESLRCNLAGWTCIMLQRCSVGFRSGERGGQ